MGAAATDRQYRMWIFATIVVAAWLRLQGLDWDQGQHLHPDERFLTMVENAIAPPRSLGEYFDTAHSPLNPANHDYRFFVYGTLPLFLVRAFAAWLGMTDYGHVHFVGRIASALFDVGTVWLTIVIGARIGGRRLGLLAGALVACSVTSIQNAHFFTVDSTAAFFATASLCAALRVADVGSPGAQLLFGALFGATLGCRINLALLAAVYPLALLHAWRTGRASLPRLAGGAVAAALTAILVFRIVQPYAFAGPGFFGLAIAGDFLASMREIRGFATGAVDFPPGVQWIGRLPLLFAGKNLLVWGIGPVWGVAALAGIAWWIAGRGVRRELPAAVVLLWGLTLFGYHAAQFAATGRYFLPVVPVLAVFAAWPLAAAPRRVRRLTAIVLIAATAAWAVAFTAIYRRPMSRVEASRWIYRNIPVGATIATEHWDDGLPLAVDDAPRGAYHGIELHLYDDDTAAKRRTLVDQLAQTDYIILSSNRLYRSIPRTPWRYPMTRRYYELLFSGALGFRLERSFTSYPRLGPLEIADDGAEEAFTVYDHPHVLIFKKTPSFSREGVDAMLGAVSLSGIVRPAPRDAAALYRQMRPTDVPLPEPDEVRTAVVPSEPTSLGMWLRWTASLELLSLACFALLFAPLRDTSDRGYGLAKLVAWLGPGYGAWLCCSVGVAPNTPATVRTVAVAFVLAGAASAWRRREELRAFLRTARRELVVIEAVLLGVMTLFVAARALNPAIFWGEKPMDFAYLNAILRARTMPPADPWFAGATLNYFYFGHALVAFFAEMSGVPAAFAFNLAIGTVGGLLAVAAFLVGRRVGGAVAAGVLAAVAVTVLGNLDGVVLLAESITKSTMRAIDFHYYWATSRVIDGTINEFPAWNLLFADLHAHVLAQPLEVGALYVALLWIGSPATSRWTVAILAAWIAGAIAATSAWSVPTTLCLQLAFLLTAWRRDPARGLRSFVAVLVWSAAVVVASRVLFWPFWASYRRPSGRGWDWETGFAPLGDVAIIFGLFLLAVVPPLAAVAISRRGRRGWATLIFIAIAAAAGALRSPSAGLFAALAALGLAVWWEAGELEWQAIAVMVGIAGAIGVATELVWVWDRMNTVFKYYLEMWLLLGCAAGAAVACARRRSRSGHRVWVAALGAASIAALFTTLSGAYGLLRYPFAPSDVPTLDGMNYLRQMRPGELAAYRWLQREVRGVPVLLEASGDAYQDYARVSMNTGLPTVVGWEYHLFQQAHAMDEIRRRREDVTTIYETDDLDVAQALLRRYHVDLVFVGPLERRTYARAPAGLAKFQRWPLLRSVFNAPGVTIYATPGLEGTVKTWVEPVAAPAAAAAPFGIYREPRDVARAPDGTLWVADFGNRRIQHVDALLHAIGGFGAEGDGPGEFRDPCGVAVDASGDVYVADTWNHRVQKLSPKGESIAEWAAGFYGPRGIALDRQGRVFVADTGNRRIVRLSPQGVVEKEWGRAGDVLSEPVGIAVSARDEVYVADTGHSRVAVFSPDGELRRTWPIDGWRQGTLREPHLDVGPDGTVWVADPGADRVLLFDEKGRPRGVAQSAQPLSIPIGVAVVDATHAVVSNAGGHSLAFVSRTANTSVEPD